MAGETQKSTALTNKQASPAIIREARLARGRERVLHDSHQFAAATELEAADVIIFDMDIPSNAIYGEIAMYNDDMDTGCAATLVLDFGLAAGEDFTSVTGGTETKHSEDDVLDADLLVDGSTTGQAATTNYTVQTPDPTTLGPEDALKPMWELLGYDEDPKTVFRLCMTSQAASSALASAADCAVRMKIVVD